MTDKEFLQWIYNRMAKVHKEDVFFDYMQRLKKIIDKMPNGTSH